MLIEIHIIQNHSPSNLNRDDLGAPKTCIFGGVIRARMSSQCQKRSIRNPGNPDDAHNREPGMFAQAMKGHIGKRTKFFPWLVEQALADSGIPDGEHDRIVLAAQRIAVSKEKDDKRTAVGATTDLRRKTRQLIHLGPDHAKYFVAKLAELRDEARDRYDYFLNPVVGFQEMVRELLDESGLNEKERDKIVKASWTIAKCRMSKLLQAPEGEEPEPEPAMEDDQPGPEHAKLLAERLSELRISDPNRFKDLTKATTTDEKSRLKEDAPEKPKKMDEFMEALKTVNRCDAVDIALFGRMTTSDAFEDVEAAMQVAHAISTHAVVNEVDYFTAVDDLGKTGGGAGHVDEAQFNSACFYKYFCLDWDQLVHNLAPEPQKPKDKKDDSSEVTKWKKHHSDWANKVKPDAERLAACTLGHFIRAAALTTPSGKQNSFASNCEPCGILVEIKKNEKTPSSYANAFAEPARKIGNPPNDAADCVSLVGRSIAQLGDHVYQLRKAYQTDSTLLWYALPLWRYPLQGWERETDGSKAKVRNEKGEPTKDYKPAVQFASSCLDVLGGRDTEQPGLVEAVIDALKLNLKWAEVKDLGEVKGG